MLLTMRNYSTSYSYRILSNGMVASVGLLKLIVSESASVDLSGPLNCEGNQRANYFVITVDIRFDARSTVNTSS